MLAHEVAKEVEHQQQLFPEVTESPENESTEVAEGQNEENLELTANVTTTTPVEETSGSGDSAESESSATEGSSESEEVSGMFNLIDGLSVESESESESTGSRFVPDP